MATGSNSAVNMPCAPEYCKLRSHRIVLVVQSLHFIGAVKESPILGKEGKVDKYLVDTECLIMLSREIL